VFPVLLLTERALSSDNISDLYLGDAWLNLGWDMMYPE
jgi:hypothetical protein